MNVAFSFDWDYFYDENGQDWGHREAPFFIDTIWTIRAQEFALRDKNYLDYRAVGVAEFLERLKRLAIKIPALYVSESHCYAYSLYAGAVHADHIINFDTHSDMVHTNKPEDQSYVDCGNWLYQLLKRKPKMKATWIVPDHSSERGYDEEAKVSKLPNFSTLKQSFFDTWWRNKLVPSARTINLVIAYACRSGAWTPPWNDAEFQQFIDALTPTQLWHEEKKLTPRAFEAPSAEQIAEMRQQLKLAHIENERRNHERK